MPPTRTTLFFCLVAAVFLMPTPGHAFDPRNYRLMPDLSEVTNPNLSTGQVKERCLQVFNNKRYTGAITRDTENTDRQNFWPGVMFAAFSTAGTMVMGPKLKRPLCEVRYSWKTKFDPGGSTTVYFDGRFLVGSDFFMESKADTLILTRYYGDGRRAWATLSPK